VNQKKKEVFMKRGEKSLQILNAKRQLKALSIVSSRLQYSAGLGETYGTSRDMYQTLGWKKVLEYSDFYRKFQRNEIAKMVIQRIAKSCWSNPPRISDSPNEVTEFSKEWAKLVTKKSIFRDIYRSDKLLGLGRYAVILLGLDDTDDFTKPVNVKKVSELLYIQPYSEDTAKIDQFDTRRTSPRYGSPEMYDINPDQQDNQIMTIPSFRVHHSRILHIVEEPMENNIYGVPRLEGIYNRLDDIEKILGGSAEMFWRNASPGKVAKADPEYQFGTEEKDDLQTQFDEYEHNLRRWLKVQGVDIKNLETNIMTPRDFIEVQLNAVSIATGIPKRILMGSERGELSSNQDEKTWNNLVRERMENFCTPEVLKPLIDRLIEYGILPEPKNNEYRVDWKRMSALGEKEKSEINYNKTKSLKEYTNSPGADMLVPPEIFLRDIMDFDEETIQLIKSELEDNDFSFEGEGTSIPDDVE
jgi:hypothetical protein